MDTIAYSHVICCVSIVFFRLSLFAIYVKLCYDPLLTFAITHPIVYCTLLGRGSELRLCLWSYWDRLGFSVSSTSIRNRYLWLTSSQFSTACRDCSSSFSTA